MLSIWNEFVYGGHLFALGAVSAIYTISVLLGIDITWDFLVIVYLGIYAPYLYNHYKEFNKDLATNPERTQHLSKRIRYMPLIVALALLAIAGILLYFHKYIPLLFTCFLVLLSITYTLLAKRITTRVVGLKNFYISLTFALIPVLLALYYSKSLISLPLLLVVLFWYLRMFVNTTVFDIKDIESDKEDGLLTLPIVLGKKGVLIFLCMLNLITVLPIIVGWYVDDFPTYSLMLILVVPYTFCYIYALTRKRVNTSFLYNVVVDGEFILWSLFVLLGKAITMAF
jgi:4-hydroxybenzoate polyprenyltransferase